MAFGKIAKLATATIKTGWLKFNSLIDDLLSTSSGKGASQLGLRDVAGNVDADNIEDAITEIYADHKIVRELGKIFDENSATTTGTTWGYHGGNIRDDNTVTVIADGTTGLVDDATNYIEIDGAGNVTDNTTGFTSGKIPIRLVVCADGEQSTSTDKRAFYSITDTTTPVTKGGTGLTTITNHGIMLGSGAGDITPLAIATHGQLPVGSTDADPVLATLTGTANQINIANAAGSITISVLARLADISALAVTNSNFIVGDGSNFVLENAVTALVSLGITATAANLNKIGAVDNLWIYANTAPTGWNIISGTTDALIACKGGSNAYNTTGGQQRGTWTQPNHNHTGTNHNHTTNWPISGWSASGESQNQPAAITGGTSNNQLVTRTFTSSSNGTGATGNGATTATYRPKVNLGITIEKT